MGREPYWNRSMTRGEEKGNAGCINGILQFLDFHQLLFSATSNSSNKYETKTAPESSAPHHLSPRSLEGLEAPRNSLDLNEKEEEAPKEEYFDVPLGIQINHRPTAKTNKREKMAHYLEEERKSSQVVTPRTRSVVARLMGLEELPDQASTPAFYSVRSTPTCPSPPTPALRADDEQSTKKTKKQQRRNDEFRHERAHARKPLHNRNSNIMGSYSLPDTPRASAERRSSDFDPRLSLHLYKENNVPADYSLPFSPLAVKANVKSKACSRYQEENKTPRSSESFAREIVKQVKESISCRRCSATSNGDETKVTQPKSSKALASPSCSPSRESFESTRTDSSTASDQLSKPRQRGKPTRSPPPPPEPQAYRPEAKTSTDPSKCKKVGYERFTKNVKRSAPSSTSERKKRSSMPTIFSLNKTITPPPLSGPVLGTTTAKMDEGKVAARPLNTQNCHKFSMPERRVLDLVYVRSILEHANLIGGPTRWHSASHAIDPIIFHRLELKIPPNQHHDKAVFSGHLRHRWNRKLLFHLVDEIVGDLIECRSHIYPPSPNQDEPLLARVWSRIQTYPSADCQVIGDIDALVGGDLRESNVRRLILHPAVAEEGGWVVAEIEQHIIDVLVGEMMAT